MVDFNKLLHELRERTPEERAQQRQQQQEEWDRRVRDQVAELVLRVEKAASLPNPTPDEHRFILSLQQRASRPGAFTDIAGGELLSLTDAQRSWLQRLAARADAPRPAPGSRAERYGRYRG